jgi:hypothetical protein
MIMPVNRNAAKNGKTDFGKTNLGKPVAHHAAACFSNGGRVKKFADGDSAMFGDAPVKDEKDYRMDEPAEAPMKTTEEAEPSPSSTPDSAPIEKTEPTSGTRATEDRGYTPAVAAGAAAGAKQAVKDAGPTWKERVNRAGDSILASEGIAPPKRVTTKVDVGPVEKIPGTTEKPDTQLRGRGGVPIADPAAAVSAALTAGKSSRAGPRFRN